MATYIYTVDREMALLCTNLVLIISINFNVYKLMNDCSLSQKKVITD